MKSYLFYFWIGIVTAIPANAQWQLIDNFEQWKDGEIFYDATNIGWHASALEQTDEYWMLKDPVNPDNVAMYVESGNYGIGYGKTFVMKTLPGGGIGPSEVGTLFFRCLWDGYANNWHMGTSDKLLLFDEETGLQTSPGAFSDLNALIRMSIDEWGVIQHRDGDNYVKTRPEQIPLINKWYNFWMVVENTWDMTTTPPICTGIHTLYVEGEGIGNGVSPTLIPVGTDPSKSSAYLRRPPFDANGNPRSIIWAVFETDSGPPGGGGGGDVFYLDDFYFSKGENLSNPLDDWAGYSIDPSGVVNTGNFLGWLNVTTTPYIWSYSLNGWIYMDEPMAGAMGAWGYFLK